jgi:superfamily II DNA or RNA helicase
MEDVNIMNIEKYLVLNKYLLSLFGVSDIRDLLNELKNKSEGTDSDGRSHFVNALRGIEKLKIPSEALLTYDENIQSYLRKINYKREPVSLKYFQYLAVLFAEVVLDNLKNRKLEFLCNLNEFLRNYEDEEVKNLISEFNENDLRKLAFWMATGSGKTLIAHINYHQFFHYNLFSPDNILFITPNEGLSKQHFEELEKSGIPCRHYAGSLNSGLKNENEVLVIEMTKFVEEKKGGGITLPVDVFEGRNLVFVDEGHKGQAGKKEGEWKKRRNLLTKDGFVFEYSATFGQILDEKKENKETLKEYSKSIVFDYSYKYFYLDGYGKDFSILNVKQAKISEREFQEAMFVANLLSFYEQILFYEKNKRLAKEHNLEKPLWVFVGTTVVGKRKKKKTEKTNAEKETVTDVIQIVEFINRVIKDEDWVKKWTEDILNGNTKLRGENDKDVFSSKFEYLKEKGVDFDDLYQKVFGGKGNLRIYELKNAEGELGLKISENEYFGVINIGDVSGFKKQLEEKGISVEQDAVSGSLFDDIKKEGSKINLLIGAKKFIEGWDTWRVSSMGLLNIGKGQGPQIIQLFGRGVRLKGKGMSLKRSVDDSVRCLETLNIYGVKADYLSRFLEAIRKEEVEFEIIEIPVKPQHEEKWKTLYTLSKDKNKKFEEVEILRLEIDNNIYFTIDLLPKVSVYLATERREEGIKIDQIKGKVEDLRFTEDIEGLLDWEKIWQEVCEFKVAKGYWNLVLDRNGLKSLLLSDRYKIMAFPELLEVKRGNDLRRLEEIAILVIKKYLDLFYGKYAKDFETKNLHYDKVGKQLPLFVFEKTGKKYGYTVEVKKEERKLIAEIRNLAKDLKKLLKDDEETLPRICFDSHLYVPILLQSKKIDRISPAGLVESEYRFVIGLREYLRNNKHEFSDVEVYLLRNYPSSGIGFQLEWSKFYPDFIMWVKQGVKQTIVFIDPKGLEHTKELNDEKILFAGTIKQIEQNLGKSDMVLESFILSKTPYEKLIEGKTKPPSKEEYIKHHVLFLDDSDWPGRLLSNLTKQNSP